MLECEPSGLPRNTLLLLEVYVGTALPSTSLRTVSLSNRVAVRHSVRTGTSPVPTKGLAF